MTELLLFFFQQVGYIPEWIVIVHRVLMIAGLFFLFPKCGIKRVWAFVPWIRYYQLGRAANMTEEAPVWALCSFMSEMAAVWYIMTNLFSEAISETSVYLAFLFMLIFLGISLVYGVRISTALCRNFSKSPMWSVGWIFFDAIPMLFWGLNKDCIPQKRADEKKTAAVISGNVAETLENGLTIDIRSRTVMEGLKRKQLLRDIHLSIPPERMVLLLGGSGAGKSCFIGAVNGYEQADATILLNGQNVYQSYNNVKYDIGYVPQKDLVRFQDTVYNVLNQAALLRMPKTVSKKERKARVEEVMEAFGLAAVKDHRIAKLSGGQQKRVSIAIEFMSDPQVYMLDEPDSGLDGVLAKELMQRLNAISRRGKIILVITHSPDRVIEYFDEVIVLAKDEEYTGRLAFYGSIDEAKKFFERDTMEEIVKSVNRVEEGGEGRADELIEKFEEMRYETK